jgi:hypothetical protein
MQPEAIATFLFNVTVGMIYTAREDYAIKRIYWTFMKRLEQRIRFSHDVTIVTRRHYDTILQSNRKPKHKTEDSHDNFMKS